MVKLLERYVLLFEKDNRKSIAKLGYTLESEDNNILTLSNS